MVNNATGTSPKLEDKIQFVDITKDNIKIVKELNDRIFDLVYQPPFYKHILHHGKRNFNKIVQHGSNNIGVVLCKYFYLDENLDSDMRIPDKLNGAQKNSQKSLIKSSSQSTVSTDISLADTNESTIIKDGIVYIAAFGLIPMFRNQGIGKIMMKYIFKLAEDTPGIKYIGLHVHSPNEDAMKFYKYHGFNVAQMIQEYYIRLQPRSAYFLVHVPKALESTESSSQVLSNSQEI